MALRERLYASGCGRQRPRPWSPVASRVQPFEGSPFKSGAPPGLHGLLQAIRELPQSGPRQPLRPLPARQRLLDTRFQYLDPGSK